MMIEMFDIIVSVVAFAIATYVLVSVIRWDKKMNKRAEKLEKGFERLRHPVHKDD